MISNRIATPPGETIKEQLKNENMDQKEFAIRMDMSEEHINRLIKGETPLTPEIAYRLELVLGVPAKFWNNLENIYRGKLVETHTETVSVQEVIDVIENYPYCDWNVENIEEMVRRINALPRKSTEQNLWIPLSERLPEEDGEYLVTYEEGYAEEYGSIGIAPFEVDCEGFGVWQENRDPDSLGSLGTEWTEIPVVAWMPLPEPHKKCKDNEIVRCKDCKYYEPLDDSRPFDCPYGLTVMKNSFCSYGERR